MADQSPGGGRTAAVGPPPITGPRKPEDGKPENSKPENGKPNGEPTAPIRVGNGRSAPVGTARSASPSNGRPANDPGPKADEIIDRQPALIDKQAMLHDLLADIEREQAAQQTVLDSILNSEPEPIPAPAAAIRPPARRPWIIVAAAAIVVLLVAGALVAVLTNRRSSHPQGAPPPSVTTVIPPLAPVTMTTAAERWIRANVTTTTTILGDAGITADLIASGYPSARQVDGSWQDATYAVSTSMLRDDPSRTANVEAVIASSAPVATYGSGPDLVQVRRIIIGGIAGLSAALARDATARRIAGPQLLTNPKITVDAASRPVFASGALDLRASTFLALLAARGPLAVSNVITDPGEAAAGLPSRALEVRVSDSAAIALTLQALPSAYRPTSVAGSGTDSQLRWPIALPPVGSA
jgi:hypothetical protein